MLTAVIALDVRCNALARQASPFARIRARCDVMGLLRGGRHARQYDRMDSGACIGGQETMGIIAWIVLGAIAGWITNMIMGGREGVIATIILGIIGAVVGGYLAGTVLKVADVTGVNIESIIVSVIGAVIVVAVYRAVTGRRTAV
jgi:uncharacterized membrane protein YeaQ/YmgE (transglycosylase-associated protein family)